MTAPFIAPAFPPDDGTVMWSAVKLAAYADAMEDVILEQQWQLQRECWENRIAANQAAYRARRNRENADA